MYKLLALLVIFLLNCSDDTTESLPDGASPSLDMSPDSRQTDTKTEPDGIGRSCDWDSTESCTSLGFYGGELNCDETSGNLDTSGCLSCKKHVSKSGAELSSSWTLTGPPGGNITTLLALENNVILAGTGWTRGSAGARPLGYGSAIYRSTDGGKSFATQQRFVDPNGNVVRNFSRVGNTNRIYAAVGAGTEAENNGIWMSDDAGQTWVKDSQGIHEDARPRRVAVAAGDPERVYTLIEGTPSSPRSVTQSLYRKDNGGMWQKVQARGTTDGEFALATHPTDRDIVYIAGFGNFYKSTNAGEDFSAFATLSGIGFTSTYVPNIAIDPNDNDHLFITTKSATLMESVDGGQTWAEGGLPFGQRDLVFSENKVWVATRGSGLQVIENGALNAKGRCLLEPFPTAIAIAPDDASKVYLGFDGQGLLHSEDGGEVFAPQESGIDDLLAKVIVTGSEQAPRVWIVSPAGLFLSTDRGDTWERVADNQTTLAFTHVAQDPDSPDRVLVGTNGDWYAGGGISAGVFDLNLKTGVIHGVEGLRGDSPEINGLAFDPTDASIVYAYQDQGADGDGGTTLIHRSTDGGRRFSTGNILGKSFNGNTVCSGNLLSLSKSGKPYFCSRPLGEERTASIFSSEDKGETYESIWSGESSSIGNKQIYFPYSGMYVDSNDMIYFTAAGNNGLAKSSDGGSTFEDFGNGLQSFATQVWDMTFETTGAGIFVATTDGVYYAENGQDFVPINEGLESFIRGNAPNERGLRGHSVAFLPGSPKVVFFSSTQGVYRRTLP